MLKVAHVSKSFSEKKILKEVSFSTEQGALYGIVGENGAGKSTLLKIIVGELSADSGDVYLNGKIGYCPQESLIFSMLTVEENFAYFAAGYGLTTKANNDKWKKQRDRLMEQLGFSSYLKFRTDRLSGGTRQKLNLSLSLLHDPEILILDEPYGGFDWETYHHFWQMILQLKQEGRSIILVTHLLNDRKHFDHIFTLKEGRLQ